MRRGAFVLPHSEYNGGNFLGSLGARSYASPRRTSRLVTLLALCFDNHEWRTSRTFPTMFKSLNRIRVTTAFIAIAPLGVGTALSDIGDAMLYTVLPTHPADAGIALADVGIMLSINRLIRLVTNGPAGWVYDRARDRRAVFIAALAVGAISTALYASADGFEALFVARLLWGLAWSGIWVGGNAIVLGIAPRGERGQWVGMYQLWFFFGPVLGSLLGGVFTDAFGYRSALVFCTIISAFGVILAAIGLAKQHHLKEPSSTPKPIEPRPRFAMTPDLRALSPRMWTAITAHGANRLIFSGVVSSALGLLIEQLRGNIVGVATITGTLLAARTLVSLISAPIAGAWSDRLGSRWGLLTISSLIGAVGMSVLAIPNIFAALIGTLFGAIASGSIQSLTAALVGDLSVEEHQGRNLGVFHTAGDLGSAIGPLAAFALLPITGLYVVFLGCAVLMLIVAAWTKLVQKSDIGR